MRTRSVLAGVTAAALLASSAFAETAPLPAGKPAGAKQANLFGLTGLPLVLTVAVIGVAIAGAAGGFNGGSSTTTTTGTGG